MTTTASHRIEVALAERAYPIVIGSGLLQDVSALAAALTPHRAMLVTNDTLWPLYGEVLTARLNAAGAAALSLVLPDGEAHKNADTLMRIYDALLAAGCDRHTTLIALGGGVIGDMVGFAAATYQRGVPFVQIPTTLLAQVDSSVGGKAAINHPLGKNMIGAFHQPRQVWIDTATLHTLPVREFRAGLAEVIKYGAALDAAFLEWLERNIAALNDREPAALAYAIRRSCELKARIVAADERETARDGGRALLNFGHTFGHAIETALGYGVQLHGEAVARGMALAARFAAQRGMLADADAARLIALIERAGLVSGMPDIPADNMIAHMARDKKNAGGAIRLVLLRALGEACTIDDTPHAVLRDFLHREHAAAHGGVKE